jgi:DNA excision repair protein ERCC-2
MSLSRNVICPLIVSKGNDQIPMTSKFDVRNDIAVLSNYGRLVVELAKVVPDGMVGFFTSYRYMEDVIAVWKDNGIIDQILQHKLIFLETKDIVETTLALDAFKKACSCGRGAIFFSVARGKVAEGIDFDRHFGRCVIMFGIPFQYTLSRVLRARLEYLRENFQISEADFLTFDALRQTAQCVGRVIRSKTDYGIMLFADARFSRADKRSKLPAWITQYLDKSNLNLSTDRTITIVRDFLKKMAQPRSQAEDIGITMLSETDIRKRINAAMETNPLTQPQQIQIPDNSINSTTRAGPIAFLTSGNIPMEI